MLSIAILDIVVAFYDKDTESEIMISNNLLEYRRCRNDQEIQASKDEGTNSQNCIWAFASNLVGCNELPTEEIPKLFTCCPFKTKPMQKLQNIIAAVLFRSTHG